jgi:two-component system chemotaxis sensor kinase CheA
MTESRGWFDRVEDALTDLARGTITLAKSKARLRDVASLLDDSGTADGQTLAGLVRSSLQGITAAKLPQVLETIHQRWETLKASVMLQISEPASPELPAQEEPPVDDELATLASDPEMAGMFVGEAIDHLGTIESALLQLESTPDDIKLLNDVFRPFHTIKGNAGALGVTSVQKVAHTVENLLDLARAGRHAMGVREFDVVLKAVDLLMLMIQELPARIAGHPASDLGSRCGELIQTVDLLIAGGNEPAAASTPDSPLPGADSEPAAAPAPSSLAGDAASVIPSATTLAASVAPGPGDAIARNRRWDDGQTTVKVDTRKLDNLIDMVGELVIAQSILAEDPAITRSTDERLGRRMAQLKRITSDLQRNAMAMRMVPIRQTFQKMARLVRDLGKKSGKSIELNLQGEDTELDRRVVEDINDPLMHMVRNSVDHGIEMAAARLAAGKPAQAILRLSAFHQAGNIVIEIADDGAGLKTDAIYAKAVERGVIEAGTPMAPADIHELIFQPGFSTAEKVTEISGRGVGMDVVRRNIEALRGQIEIQTARGQGTTFSIRLPLTLAIVDGIMLGVGAERFVMPTFAVRESLRPTAGQVHTVHGRPCMVQVRERLIPILHIGELFSVPGARPGITEGTVVVIEDNGRPLALVVDELLGKQEVVIKSLGDAFQGVKGVAGGAILGDGRIGLILDASGLVGLMGRNPLRSAACAAARAIRA